MVESLASQSIKLYFVSKIVKWGVVNYRQYPWRTTNSPYEILITEILLQRTKADQVKLVYRKLLNKCPSPHILSKVRNEELSQLLYPLGLAYRSKRLIEIGKILMEEYRGKIPLKKAELLNLPGVGSYIADSILLLSYGRGTAPVDVNVKRVLIRFYATTVGEVKKLANSLLRLAPEKRIFHYAILDFGALLCKPKNPNCSKCPVREHCSCFK